MQNAWYVLLYHDVSWEDNMFTRGIDEIVPPDLFRSHVDQIWQKFRVVSVQQGWQLYKERGLREPIVSFWFDDGLLGVRKYAYSVLEAYGIKGAISVCSRCLLRKEFFWRFKLSFLSQVDGLRFLRSRLKKFGYDGKGSVKTFTIHSFSEEIVGVIDSIYQDFTTESFRADAYRLFDTTEGIGTLAESGWEIANHTAGHYSIGAPSYMHMSEEQFDECESDLAKNLGIATRFWVVPFGYGVNAVEPAKGHKWMTEKDKIFVHVGNMANRNVDHENQLD